MKKLLLLALLPALALAATYRTVRNDTLQTISNKTGLTLQQIAEQNPNLKVNSGQNINYNAPNPAPSPVPTPTPNPNSNEIKFMAYITSYASGDNDPAGSDITYNSGIEGHAGGTGSYTDPITMASGYVGSKSDFPYGTVFYISGLKAYFKIQDTCASCHKGSGGKVWLDVYAGDYSGNGVLNCEYALTGNYEVIQNPQANYSVTLGSLYNGSTCRK